MRFMRQTSLNPLRVERGNLQLCRHSGVLSVIANSLAVVAPILSIALGVWVTDLNSDVAHLNATINGLHQDVASAEAAEVFRGAGANLT